MDQQYAGRGTERVAPAVAHSGKNPVSSGQARAVGGYGDYAGRPASEGSGWYPIDWLGLRKAWPTSKGR